MKGKNYVWVFVAVALLAGVAIGTIITGNIALKTGVSNNAPNADGGGEEPTYATYQGVLSMLNQKCHVTSMSNMFNQSIGTTCNQVCYGGGVHNEICIGASFEEYRMENGIRYTAYAGDLISCDEPMYPSSFGGTTTYSCMCCSLP